MTASSSGKGTVVFLLGSSSDFLPLVKPPESCSFFYHGALLELVPDGECMVWAGRLEMLLKVIDRLPRLALEITPSGSDMFFIRVVHLLVVVIIVIACSNYDPLGAPLWSFLTAFSASLSTFAGSLGWCPSAVTKDHLPIALDEDGPDHLCTRGVLGGNVKHSFVFFG
jgi:hypothetical protein